MITPRCKTSQVERFVSSSGHYFPCCWIANLPHVNELKDFLGDAFDDLSLRSSSPQQVEKSRAWQMLEASWKGAKPFSGCAYYCSGQFDHSAKNTTDKSKIYRP